MPKFGDMTDAELVEWMKNVVTVAGTSPADYGMTAAQITSLDAKADDLEAKMALRVTADDAAEAATTAQSFCRGVAEPECSGLNITIKANTGITVENKKKIGIDMPKPATHPAPVRPEDVTANGYEDGHNTVKWKRMGNLSNTMFIIEFRYEDQPEFSYLISTTQTRHDHSGIIVGKRCYYRVKASRAGEESSFSNVAMVY